jgi:hypothetical protein
MAKRITKAAPVRGQVTTTIEADGTATVMVDYGTNPDGTAAAQQWRVRPDQIERQLINVADIKNPWIGVKPGDVTAMRDAAAAAAAKAAQDKKNQ